MQYPKPKNEDQSLLKSMAKELHESATILLSKKPGLWL
jgi:hypothetical protein